MAGGSVATKAGVVLGAAYGVAAIAGAPMNTDVLALRESSGLGAIAQFVKSFSIAAMPGLLLLGVALVATDAGWRAVRLRRVVEGEPLRCVHQSLLRMAATSSQRPDGLAG